MNNVLYSSSSFICENGFEDNYSSNSPCVMLHGLFGMSENVKSIERMLQGICPVISYDLPNHGKSPSLIDCTLMNMAHMLHNTLSMHVYSLGIETITLLGHSLGGKLSMLYALLYPERVESLVVLDIAPVKHEVLHEKEIRALLELNRIFSELKQTQNTLSSVEIRDIIYQHVQDEEITSFLRKNVYRKKDATEHFDLYVRIEHIAACYDHIRSFPLEELADACYIKPTLFIIGGASNYVRKEHYAVIEQLFSAWELEEIPHAPHAIHAYKPLELKKILQSFFI